MRNVFLNAENQRDFENKGYSTMPMLSSQEVNLVLSELQLMKPDDNFNPESSSEQPSYHLTDFDGNIEYKIKAKKLISRIIEPHLKNIFDNYKIITTNFIIKPPGKGKFIVHQDWTFVVDTKNYTSLTFWCPLVDTNEENGTLQIVEGSHKIVPDIATSTVDFYCKNFENAIVEKYGTPIYLNAGECLVFDHSILHFSDDNHSSKPRYVMQAILVPSEIEPVFYYFDVNEPEKGFEVFQTKPDFFLFQDFLKRPSNLKSLGFIENRNRLLTEEEFIEKMKKKSHIGKGGSRSLVSVNIELFEDEDEFYDRYIAGQKPEGVKSLGTFDYEVDPLTPEQLVEFMSEPQPKVDKCTGIREKLLLFFNLLRGSDWWFYKIPPLLAIAYAEILLQATPPQQSIATLLTLLASMFFVAAYGHVINDIFDVEVDLQAGKQNRMASLSNPQRLLLCVTLAGLGLVPWLFIGLGTRSAILLAAIYILLTIYSAPPLRLKERDIWGAIADAAQVHAVPTLLVATVFSHLADTLQPESVVLATAATAWAFLAGIRGILLHQIWDRDSDLSAGVTTLITRIGVESARFWITYVSFPLELLLLTLLILVISQFAPSFLIFCALYILLRIISTQSAVTALDPAPAQKTYILPHDFYEVWLPLALLILLAIREPVFLSLLVIHIGLFYPAIAQRGAEFNPLLLSGLKRITSLVKLAHNDSDKEIGNLPKSHSENLHTTFIESPSTELEHTIAKAIDFLEQNQLDDGEFQTQFDQRHETPNHQIIEKLVFDSSPFVTSLVLYSLSFLSHENKVQLIIKRGVSFLLQEMELGGLWRYWSSKNEKHSMIPPDLDDICCISYVLRMNNVALPKNIGIILSNKNPQGLFYTWLFPNSLKKLSLWLLTRGKAFSYSNELWKLTNKDDVCSIVNANVLLYLGETQQTRKVIQYLIDIVLKGTEDPSTSFYNHKLSFYYMLSRAYFTGVNSLGLVKIPVVNRVLNLQKADGSFGDELLTALAVCTLLNLNYPIPSLDKAIDFLLKTQELDGSWQRIPMYGGQLDTATFGSAELTTALCVEALARYRLLDMAGNIQQSKTELQQLQTQLQHTEQELTQSQSQLSISQAELAQVKTDLQQTQDKSEQFQAQLQQTEQELTQSQSELHTSQTELAQLKSYLQQTQGVEGLMSYYRSRIASNPVDDIQLYHQALTIKPDDDQILLQLGNALVRQNRFDDAIASYQTALQFQPDNFEIHLELGKALEKVKKWDEAIAAYRRAIELNPDYSRSHKHLGDILAECGQINEASVSYRRALQLQPRIF